MKLGEMPRYTKDWEGDMYAFHDGEWVRFSDAQAKSLADERRIKVLEEHILTLCECLESDPEMSFDYTHQIREARVALRVGDANET